MGFKIFGKWKKKEGEAEVEAGIKFDEEVEEKKPKRDKVSVDELIESLVGVNINLRTKTVPIAVLEVAEDVIDKLIGILPQVSVKFPGSNMAVTLNKVIVDYLPKNISTYLQLGSDARQNKAEVIKESLNFLNERLDVIITAVQDSIGIELDVEAIGLRTKLFNEEDVGLDDSAGGHEVIDNAILGDIGAKDDFFNRIKNQLDAIRTIVPLNDGESGRYCIKDVGTNGCLRFDRKVYLVKEISRYDGSYKSEKWSWYELKLFCLNNGETVYIEWEEDGEIEISQTLRSLKFADLRDDEGGRIDSGDLNQIVGDDEDIVYDGRAFEYEDSYKATYYRGNKKGDDVKGEKLHVYEFEASNDQGITIENWDGEFQVSLSGPVKRAAVLALGEAKTE